jgi:hypothetical protein
MQTIGRWSRLSRGRRIFLRRRVGYRGIFGTERGRFYFVLCKDDAFRDRLFHQLSLEPGVMGLDQVKGEDIDPELPPRDIVPYFCHLRKVKDIEQEFLKQDKTVAYLSTEMFMSVSASKFNELDADMDFDIQEVDLEYISLR